jgi:hypothetical protein
MEMCADGAASPQNNHWAKGERAVLALVAPALLLCEEMQVYKGI